MQQWSPFQQCGGAEKKVGWDMGIIQVPNKGLGGGGKSQVGGGVPHEDRHDTYMTPLGCPDFPPSGALGLKSPSQSPAK